MHVLRRIARKVRDRARRTPPPILMAVITATVLLAAAVVLVLCAVLAPMSATLVVVGLLAAVTLATVIAAWLHLAKRIHALRAATDRVEVTQRRILAAIEQERLDAERRRSIPV